MDYRDQIERLKQRSNSVAIRLAGYLPDSLVQFWVRSERPARWGLVGALMGSGVFVLVIPVFILVTLTSPGLLFEGIPVLVFVAIASGVNFGLLGYCIAKRSKQERVGPIVGRVIVGYLLGGLIPVIGMVVPFLAIFFWGMPSGVTRGTKLTSVSELQRYLKTTEENYLRQRNLSAIEPKFQIGGVELSGYLEQLGFFMVGYL